MELLKGIERLKRYQPELMRPSKVEKPKEEVAKNNLPVRCWPYELK